jgi:hypothetical protein
MCQGRIPQTQRNNVVLSRADALRIGAHRVADRAIMRQKMEGESSTMQRGEDLFLTDMRRIRAEFGNIQG